ncbi:MAG: hypothetical protein ACH346_05300 [Chthoniobacterales bacterium]
MISRENDDLKSNLSDFMVTESSRAILSLTLPSTSVSSISSWEKAGTIIGVIGLVALCSDLVILQDFRNAANNSNNFEAQGLIIRGEGENAEIIASDGAGENPEKIRSDNNVIVKRLQTALEEEHSPEVAEKFINEHLPKSGTLIESRPSLSTEVLHAILTKADDVRYQKRVEDQKIAEKLLNDFLGALKNNPQASRFILEKNNNGIDCIQPREEEIDPTPKTRAENRTINNCLKDVLKKTNPRIREQDLFNWRIDEPLTSERLAYFFNGLDYLEKPLYSDEISRLYDSRYITKPSLIQRFEENLDWEKKYADQQLEYFQTSYLQEIQDLCKKMEEATVEEKKPSWKLYQESQLLFSQENDFIQRKKAFLEKIQDLCDKMKEAVAEENKTSLRLLQNAQSLFSHKNYYIQRKEAFQSNLQTDRRNLEDENIKQQRKKIIQIKNIYNQLSKVGAQESDTLKKNIEQLLPERIEELRNRAQDRLRAFKKVPFSTAIECQDALEQLQEIITYSRRYFYYNLYDEIVSDATGHFLEQISHYQAFVSPESPLIKTLGLACEREHKFTERFGSKAASLMITDLSKIPGKERIIYQDEKMTLSNIELPVVTSEEFKNSIENLQKTKQTLRANIDALKKTGTNRVDLDQLMKEFFPVLSGVESGADDIKFNNYHSSPEELMQKWAQETFNTIKKKTGNFNMIDYFPQGQGRRTVSQEASNYLGELWTREKYVNPNNLHELISADGLKRYRPPSQKFIGEGSRAETGWQSNFEWRSSTGINWDSAIWQKEYPKNQWGDCHLDVEPPSNTISKK